MIRPVEVPRGQGFGENPTSVLPAGHWILKQFGNYQPDGHSGEDYPCDVGTPIRAVTSGTVLHVGFYGGTYADNPYWIAPNFAGYCYVIDHGAFIGIYAHGQDEGARVSVGQYVSEGAIIGLSGNTGGSTGPHLHFEILPDGFVVNSRMYGRIDPETLFGGIAAQGTITTPQEEPLVPNEKDKVFWPIEGEGKVSLNELLNSIDRKASAALSAISGLLSVQLPDPSDPGKTYSLADFVVWSATNAKIAAGAAGVAATNTDPDVIAKAVREGAASIDAQSIADQLNITVKGSK